jgi:hypothetical protein
MSKNNGFIYFDLVQRVLEKNKFFGFTAKRDKGRIEYTYLSVPCHHLTFKVLTTRLHQKDITSKKIVLGIKLNDKELEGWNEFMDAIANANKLQVKINKEKYGNSKENKHSGDNS